MERIVQEVLEHPKLKALENKEELETIVTRYVKRVRLQVLAHCNREDLPEALESVVAQIAEEMLKADGIISIDKGITSISRGDTSFSYTDPSSAYQNARNFMTDYECQLVHFKRIKLPLDER